MNGNTKKNRSCFDIYITFNESIQLITLLLSFYAKVQVIDDADATVPYSLHSTPSEYAEPKKIKLKIALSTRGFVTNHWPQNNWNRVHWKMYTHCYFLSEWLFLWFINGFGVWHASVIHDFLIFFAFYQEKNIVWRFCFDFPTVSLLSIFSVPNDVRTRYVRL